MRNATVRGTQTRFDTEYLSHVQDADGVTVRVRDRLLGIEYAIRAKYLIGADGARSRVAADLDLPMRGEMDVAGSMNITFTADLTRLVGHRPSVLYWVIQPGADVGGIGAGLVRMIRPWREWLIVWGYDIAAPPPQVDEAAAREIVRNLVSVPDLDVEITGTSLWSNNEQYATTLREGRVFCAGDAVHKHPPSNGLGSNTSIQDSYNLAWKLAAVLNGTAGTRLLDTYTAERAPVAAQIVTRANRSSREFGGFFDALGLGPGMSEADMRAAIAERTLDTPAGAAKRAALREAIRLKNYEFNAHGVELGQVYESGAVVPDGMPRRTPARDPELYYEPTTAPGARLPHVWVGDAREKLSTHDLAAYDAFTLLTGIGGQAWVEAADAVSAELGVRVATVVIGPGQRVTDLYDDWASARESGESGAIVVRPDKHVGARFAALTSDPRASLSQALTTILHRD